MHWCVGVLAHVIRPLYCCLTALLSIGIYVGRDQLGFCLYNFFIMFNFYNI